MVNRINIFALDGVPLVKPGDDLVEIIKNALIVSNERLQDDDIVVIAQKIISKAEGRIVSLNSVKPSPQAEALATKLEKDPRQIESR